MDRLQATVIRIIAQLSPLGRDKVVSFIVSPTLANPSVV